MSFPGAHAGYFAFQANESLMPQFSVCNPFEACVATCPPDVLNEAPPDYRLCPHSFNNLSCTPGYGGDRCSECASLPEGTDLNTIECDSGVDTAEEEVAFAVAHSLGFYRMNGYCLPCPCTWVKTWHMVTVIVLVLVLFLMIVDYIAQRVNHISTIVSPQPSTLHPPPSSSSSSSSSSLLLCCTVRTAALHALLCLCSSIILVLLQMAPLMILVSFFQTLALLLDLEFPWPNGLKKILESLSIFNIVKDPKLHTFEHWNLSSIEFHGSGSKFLEP